MYANKHTEWATHRLRAFWRDNVMTKKLQDVADNGITITLAQMTNIAFLWQGLVLNNPQQPFLVPQLGLHPDAPGGQIHPILTQKNIFQKNVIKSPDRQFHFIGKVW